MPTISEKLKGILRKPQKLEPLWAGPCDPGPNGGITQSMISRFLTCRERFRIRVIDGYAPVEQFNHRIEYGQMWHVCEEGYANSPDVDEQWMLDLASYTQKLVNKYPAQREEIYKWYNVCRVQFDAYLDHWSKTNDEKTRETLLAEQVFHAGYTLPSGRVVYLRGKIDGVDLIKDKKRSGLYLVDNKTKGDIDVQQIKRQLTFDLQMMFYSVAFTHTDLDSKLGCEELYRGIRYNVVRRPLSGGKGSIVRKKGSKNVPAETEAEYYARLEDLIRNATGEEWSTRNGENYFFSRWESPVADQELTRFRELCLDPILEQIACWYESVTDPNPNRSPVPAWAQNYTHPFGAVNTIDEYGSSDLDEYITTGSTLGLVRTPLFRELQ